MYWQSNRNWGLRFHFSGFRHISTYGLGTSAHPICNLALLAGVRASCVQQTRSYAIWTSVLPSKYDFRFRKPEVDTGRSLFALQSSTLITNQSTFSGSLLISYKWSLVLILIYVDCYITTVACRSMSLNTLLSKQLTYSRRRRCHCLQKSPGCAMLNTARAYTIRLLGLTYIILPPCARQTDGQTHRLQRYGVLWHR